MNTPLIGVMVDSSLIQPGSTHTPLHMLLVSCYLPYAQSSRSGSDTFLCVLCLSVIFCTVWSVSLHAHLL